MFPIWLSCFQSVVYFFLAFTSSHVESGFEDDFESVFSSRTTSPWTESSVGWSSPDSPPQKEYAVQKEFKIPAPPKAKAPPVPRPAPLSNRTQYSPTIICVQPAVSNSKSKPARPPPPGMGGANKSAGATHPHKSSGTQFGGASGQPRAPAFGENAFESSPPMPSIPPPPPPADILNILHNQPQVPPRPSANSLHEEGDIAHVIKRINDDWFLGTCDGRKGQFPSNFVQDISELDDIK
ncbi:unnamed protein product [Nesidiocoris tenuis]|uniref:SH3 domain-containing protein n=1 Tax=Nesidiocoris tenuis TaxID=355587 RepID=A0A6H5FZW0_9HEMI|nr:unnamed protein product [Nesidiocoris tenuis]